MDKTTKNLMIIVCILLILIAIASGTLLIIKLNGAASLGESVIASTCMNGLICKLVL